jgi:transposase
VLKDDLKHLRDYRVPGAARRFWPDSHRRAMASRLKALPAFARLLAGRIDGILRHCCYPLHTGLLQRINNKIKVLKRMACGYRDQAVVFLKIRAAFPGIPS